MDAICNESRSSDQLLSFLLHCIKIACNRICRLNGLQIFHVRNSNDNNSKAEPGPPESLPIEIIGGNIAMLESSTFVSFSSATKKSRKQADTKQIIFKNWL